MAEKKVDTLKERLEGEVEQLGSKFEDQIMSMEGNFTSIEGIFSNLEEMIKWMLEFQTKSASTEARALSVRQENGENPNFDTLK